MTNILCVVALFFTSYVHFFTNFDIQLQHIFYNDGVWLIDPKEPVFYFLFYILPKVVVILLGSTSLVLLLRDYFSPKMNILGRVGLVTIILSLILFPTFINLLKDILRQPCPRDLKIFGGIVDMSLYDYLIERGPVRCFPGAHASVPFSMISAIYLFRDPYYRALFLMSVLPLAFFISMYQVLRGVHFLTDTVFTAAASWLFIQYVHFLVRKFYKIK